MKVEDVKLGMKVAFPTESHGWTSHIRLQKEVEEKRYTLQYVVVTALPDEDGDVEVAFADEGFDNPEQSPELMVNLINIVDLIPYSE